MTRAQPIAAALLFAFSLPGAGLAQSQFPLGQPVGQAVSPVLIIQPERLFSESAYGGRITREIEADLSVLTAENRRIEAELRAEELELKERRKTMDGEAFRALADSFDTRVQSTRAEQGTKFEEINRRFEAGKAAFLTAAEPVLEQIMLEAGASVVLERGSAFLALPSADITDLAIARVDAVLGEGAPAEDGPAD